MLYMLNDDPTVAEAERLAHLERIEKYTERAAKRLPLFEDGPPEPPQKRGDVAVCCGCGAEATRSQRAGWQVRRLRSTAMNEAYCPTCFEIGGGWTPEI